MSEDTKFPESYGVNEFHATSFTARLRGIYRVIEIDAWFKRCMEDMPKYPKFTDDVDTWQEKWFSQFATSQREDVVLSSQLGFRVNDDE